MADRKISELTNLTGANLADDDEFPLVDTSADETKAITFGEFKTALDTATGFVRITGDTMTGNLSMGDNVKAIFGAGSDLQIYHDGTHSYISDVGTGNLRIRGTDITLQDADGNGYISMVDGGAGGTVYLKHLGSNVLTTTSTGIDVTGTVTADGLTVDGVATLNRTNPILLLNETDTTNLNVGLNVSASTFNIGKYADAGNKVNDLLSIDVSTGDISFYEDTGTTAKFFWDASAESLGIGTSSPTDKLNITGGGASIEGSVSGFTGGEVLLGNTTANTQSAISTVATGAPQMYFDHRGTSTGQWVWRSSSAERMRIDSSGNVGIGTASPAAAFSTGKSLDVNGPVFVRGVINAHQTNAGVLEYSADETRIRSYGATSGSGKIIFSNGGGGSADTERMRIDSSGNLLVGHTTVDSFTNVGHQLDADGYAIHTRTSAPSLYVGRKTTDGSIMEFNKDGATVGSIGTKSSGLVVGNTTANSALRFTANSITAFDPVTQTDTGADGDTNLGNSAVRFKDLYLSGGVYLGGTGAANKLDEYEEGTWTPALWGGTNPSVTYSLRDGKYTKIGNLVFITASVAVTSQSGGAGAVFLGNLPFNGSSSSTIYPQLSTFDHGGFTYTGSRSMLGLYMANGVNYARFIVAGSGTTSAAITWSDVSSTPYFYVSGCYYTA